MAKRKRNVFILMLCICSMYIYMCYPVSLYPCENQLNFNFKLWFASFSWSLVHCNCLPFRSPWDYPPPLVLGGCVMPGAPAFTPPLVFSGVCIAHALVFCVVLCQTLFIVLCFLVLRTNAFLSAQFSPRY